MAARAEAPRRTPAGIHWRREPVRTRGAQAGPRGDGSARRPGCLLGRRSVPDGADDGGRRGQRPFGGRRDGPRPETRAFRWLTGRSVRPSRRSRRGPDAGCRIGDQRCRARDGDGCHAPAVAPSAASAVRGAHCGAGTSARTRLLARQARQAWCRTGGRHGQRRAARHREVTRRPRPRRAAARRAARGRGGAGGRVRTVLRPVVRTRSRLSNRPARTQASAAGSGHRLRQDRADRRPRRRGGDRAVQTGPQPGQFGDPCQLTQTRSLRLDCLRFGHRTRPRARGSARPESRPAPAAASGRHPCGAQQRIVRRPAHGAGGPSY